MLLRLLFAAQCGAFVILGAPLPEGVPKDAREVSPGIYRLVDKDGKAWVYKRTPFGYQKSAEADSKPAPEAAPAAPASRNTPFGESKGTITPVITKITEEGDSLRFERPNPFGVYKWTRKKSELTDEEKKLWEEQRKPSTQTTPQ